MFLLGSWVYVSFYTWAHASWDGGVGVTFSHLSSTSIANWLYRMNTGFARLGVGAIVVLLCDGLITAATAGVGFAVSFLCGYAVDWLIGRIKDTFTRAKDQGNCVSAAFWWGGSWGPDLYTTSNRCPAF